MNLSDNVIISFSSILNTSTLPSLSFKLISILFANLSLLSFDGIILSITTLIECLKFLLNSGSSSF